MTGTYGATPVEGQLIDGKLTFASHGDWMAWRDRIAVGQDADDMYTTVHFATMNADNTLTGRTFAYIRGYNMAKSWDWTATRVKAY